MQAQALAASLPLCFTLDSDSGMLAPQITQMWPWSPSTAKTHACVPPSSPLSHPSALAPKPCCSLH